MKKMEQALKEKDKDNKRLRDNFDTLKSANDTLKKQVLSTYNVVSFISFFHLVYVVELMPCTVCSMVDGSSDEPKLFPMRKES